MKVGILIIFFGLFLSGCTNSLGVNNLKSSLTPIDKPPTQASGTDNILKFSDNVSGMSPTNLNNRKIIPTDNGDTTYNVSYNITGECSYSDGNVSLIIHDLTEYFPNQTQSCSQSGEFSFNINPTDSSFSDLKLINYVGGIKITISQNSNDENLIYFFTSTDLDILTVSSLAELQAVTPDNNTLWVLTSDIDIAQESGLSENNWDLLDGNTESLYFVGLEHTISNLHFSNPAQDSAALFPQSLGQTISYLNARNFNIEGRNNVGAISPLAVANDETYALNHVRVVYSSIIGGDSVGGLVGTVDTGILSKVYFQGTVTGNNDVGGISGVLGSSTSISCSQCVVLADITATGNRAGGISGISSSPVEDSYFNGSVSGNDFVGGILGDTESFVSRSFTVSAITASGNNAGPLIGQNLTTATNSYYSTSTQCNGCDNSIGDGLIFTDFQNQNSFTGFDFTNIWTFVDNYLFYHPTPKFCADILPPTA